MTTPACEDIDVVKRRIEELRAEKAAALNRPPDAEDKPAAVTDDGA